MLEAAYCYVALLQPSACFVTDLYNPLLTGKEVEVVIAELDALYGYNQPDEISVDSCRKVTLAVRSPPVPCVHLQAQRPGANVYHHNPSGARLPLTPNLT